jgi:hypothetical protein
MAFLYSLANNVAAQNFYLGIVSCFNVATLDVEQRSSQNYLLLSVERMYRQAPSASLLLSQNPWSSMLVALEQITFLLILSCDNVGIV